MASQRLRDLIDELDGVPVRSRPDVWPSYRWSIPEDETDNRVCHVSVEALAEAMRMRRLERDGSPCWSTVEARELLGEAMRCELELLPATVGWAQATHAKRARDRKRAAKAREG